MQQKLLTYINGELLADDPDTEIDADDELLVEGYLDSLGVMRLVAFIEEDLSLAVPPEDVTLENFGSVARLAAYLGGRAAAQGGAA